MQFVLFSANIYYKEDKMKRVYALALASAFLFAPQAHAEGWLDSIKSFFGMAADETEVSSVSIEEMMASVEKATGMSQEQVKGSLAALFSYAEKNISAEQIQTLKANLPNLDSLLSAAPDVSEMTSKGALGGLLDKAAGYSESLSNMNELKKQFDSLGLDTQQVTQIVESLKAYLDTEEGQELKTVLMDGLSSFKA
jgi:hypothetical protein